MTLDLSQRGGRS